MLWHYPSNADCRPSLRKIFCVISYNFRHTFVACCPQSYPLTHATYQHSMQFHYSHWVVQCGCQSGGIHDRQAIFHMVKTEAHGQEFLCIRAAILNEPGKRYVFGLSVCLCVRAAVGILYVPTCVCDQAWPACRCLWPIYDSSKLHPWWAKAQRMGSLELLQYWLSRKLFPLHSTALPRSLPSSRCRDGEPWCDCVVLKI